MDRDRSEPGGVHPRGWKEAASASFHGAWLREHGYPLGGCRECHGEDYAGGAVRSGCLTGCHEDGPEACGTCHGEGTDPLPASGAHATHAAFCETCHLVPGRWDAPAHVDGDGVPELRFPGWDGVSRACAGGCHVTRSPAWEAAGPLGCDGCHGAPPPSHARFERVADDCTGCHPAPDARTHLDGTLDLSPLRCDACHGEDDTGAPPPALDGSADPETRGAGAHARHLDADLPDRIGRVAACTECHAVPDSALAEGHLDPEAPADVVLAGGEYDASDARCTGSCHWEAAPVWTDVSGAGRACGSCHALPPERSRDGDLHPASAPDLEACVVCHVDEVETHVNGETD